MTDKETKKRSQTPKDSDTTELAVPDSGLASIFDEFMRPFGDFESFFPRSLRQFWSELDRRQPNIDLQDRGDKFILTAELPGFAKDDVEVRINPSSLELKAEKKSDEQKKEGDGTRRQSSYSYFHRIFSLPEEVLTDKVDGTMKNGILELKLPKRDRKPGEKTRRVDLR